MADAIKKPANPDTELDIDQLFDKLGKSVASIGGELAKQGISTKTAEGKDTSPPSDPAGLAKLTSSALRSEFKRMMKTYTGSSVRNTVADALANKCTSMRRKISEAVSLAEAIQTELKEAHGALEAQAEIYSRTNAPKIAALLAKEEKRLRDVQDRVTRLKSGASAKSKPPKRAQATA